METFLIENDFPEKETSDKKPQKRRKIVDFILPLLWFYHNTKQKITKSFYKFLVDTILLYDCEIIYGNLEMLLVHNNEEEFIDNL